MHSQSFPASKANDIEARLLTASATTGWLDWIHGELWLFPTGLLRVPLDLTVTRQHGMGPTVSQDLPSWSRFDEKTFEALIASKRNRWIPRKQIKKAYLHHGILTDRLRLELVEQRTMKFLWFPWDGAWEPLQIALQEWLGNEFVID
ncbi:MAG: hypothetical protein H0W02_02550 [Ktedonobacteraceae bacterium]|nr:hypothetical protein [Ktedonobacteraceae bacterium]